MAKGRGAKPRQNLSCCIKRATTLPKAAHPKATDSSMTALTPDHLYGPLRQASNVNTWEATHSPLSLTELNSASGAALQALLVPAKHCLFSHATRAMLLIWVMDEDCQVWIAVEEFSPHEKPGIAGFPRLEKFNEKKLGHPTLCPGKPVRIAGELFLDETEDGELKWFLNVSSGGFCKETSPTRQQTLAVLELFKKEMGTCIELDPEP